MAPDNEAKKTIKLKPLTPKAQGDEGIEETISMSRDELNSGTQPTMPKPEVPGSKQTIKLRPSSNAPTQESPSADAGPGAAKQTIKLTPKTAEEGIGDDQTVPLAKQTIKLVPKKPEEQAPGGAVKPSQPTVKLGGGEPTGATTAAPKPSEPTVKLSGGDSSKKTLSLKKPASPTVQTPTPSGDEEDGYEDDYVAPRPEKADKDEPGVLMTLVAVVTLLVVAFLGFAFFAQQKNLWMDVDDSQPLQVPGFEKIPYDK